MKRDRWLIPISFHFKNKKYVGEIKLKELFELFSIFFRIGGFTFGGGYAMLPIIQKEIVGKRNWATDEEIIDYYAIGQSTPGIIAINTATFIGYNRKGILGALFATMGMVSPSLIIITIIAKFFQQFQDYSIVQSAFGGIRIVVVALIVNTVISLFKTSVNNVLGLIIFILAFIAIAFMNVSPIPVIIISALVGIFKYRDFDHKGDVR